MRHKNISVASATVAAKPPTQGKSRIRIRRAGPIEYMYVGLRLDIVLKQILPKRNRLESSFGDCPSFVDFGRMQKVSHVPRPQLQMF